MAGEGHQTSDRGWNRTSDPGLNELSAQSESVRVYTHTNQLTYPHGEDFG